MSVATDRPHPYFDNLGYSPRWDFDVNRAVVTRTLNALADRIGSHMEAQGFWDDEDAVLHAINKGAEDPDHAAHLSDIARRWKDGEKFTLLNTEISELTEANRKDIIDSDHLDGFTMAEEEASDILIRVLDWAHRRGLRIGEAMVAKLDYNATRPFRHDKTH